MNRRNAEIGAVIAAFAGVLIAAAIACGPAGMVIALLGAALGAAYAML